MKTLLALLLSVTTSVAATNDSTIYIKGVLLDGIAPYKFEYRYPSWQEWFAINPTDWTPIATNNWDPFYVRAYYGESADTKTNVAPVLLGKSIWDWGEDHGPGENVVELGQGVGTGRLSCMERGGTISISGSGSGPNYLETIYLGDAWTDALYPKKQGFLESLSGGGNFGVGGASSPAGHQHTGNPCTAFPCSLNSYDPSGDLFKLYRAAGGY